MPTRPFLTAGFVLIWASVAVITWGTYLRTLSPGSEEYEEKVIRHFAGDGTEKRLNPAGRMALVTMFRWQFVGCYCAFIGLLFTGGVLFLRALARWKRDFALVALGAFGLGCLVGAYLGVGEAVENFRWGFDVLGRDTCYRPPDFWQGRSVP